jgi:anti-sigma regulatory factor (Ser/Thr protein kinase)
MDDTSERNRRIVEAHRAGDTLRAIAAEHDISYERVRQIVAKADGVTTKPRGKAKAGGGAGTERVRLRIGNLAKAVLVTGQAYQDPKDALNEFISNAADEYAQSERRGERIRVVLRRKAKHPVIAIDDRGRGMSPDRLREVARNLFESTKAGDDRTLGEKAIGLLGFQQLGGRIEIVSRTDDSPDTWVLTLQRGQADASLGRERRRARSEAGTTVYLSEVDPEVLRMLTQRKVIDYLRRRRGAALARGDYEIEVTEGRATELVTPEEPDGVRLAIPSRPTLWGRIEFNLYVAPDIDPRRRVAIVGRAGTTILDDIAELEELDHLPWTSGQISGQIAFEALQQSAGRRAVIRDDDAFPVFREAITSIEAVVSKTLEKLRHEIDEATADRMSDIVRKLFGRVGHHDGAAPTQPVTAPADPAGRPHPRPGTQPLRPRRRRRALQRSPRRLPPRQRRRTLPPRLPRHPRRQGIRRLQQPARSSR